MALLERVKLRCEDVPTNLLEEYIKIITDRLCLRLGTDELPEVFNSVCADATVKMVRRTYYEGISSENVANLSTSFVSDVLSEYDREVSDYKESRSNENGTGKVVRFL